MTKHKNLILKTFFSTETKAVDGSPRTLVAKISTQDPDRSKDVMVQDGVMLDNYLKNPVVMYAHDYRDLPIAKCADIKVADGGILATVQFPDEGIYEKADVVYQLYKEGFMNAWSIGYLGLDVEPIPDGGLKYNKWELYEFSAVPIPDNPDALTVMRSKGINVDILLQNKDSAGDEDETEEYTDETKVTELTVGQLKDILEDALDNGSDESTEDQDEGKSLMTKSGRTISAKHEGLLHAVLDNINEVLKSLETVDEENNDGKGLDASETLIKRLTSQLKQTDKSVGLTLRLIKTIESEKKMGGEK
ncbi:MAG: hypothetical protein M1484_01090 [Patescibacteria group bacterium]|nr:hypothetical protein [Patescibacteria group bacterium]